MPGHCRNLLLLLVFTAIVRIGILIAWQDQLDADVDGYRLLANNLLRTGCFSRSQLGEQPIPTAYRPPLYPWLIARFAFADRVTNRSVSIVHVGLGVASVVLTVGIGQLWRLRQWSLLAGTLVAIDPLLLRQSVLVMTETLAVFMAVVSLWLVSWLRYRGSNAIALAAGFALGLAALCRPTFLIWLGMIVIYRAVIQPAGGRRWSHCLLMVAGAAACLLPWAVRNYRQIGRATMTTTHGGYTLLLGNNPDFYQHLRTQTEHRTWDSQPFQDRLGHATREQSDKTHQELLDDRRNYRLALSAIRQEPAMFCFASWTRITRLWRLVPHAVAESESGASRWIRYATGIWYGAWFTVATFGGLVCWRRLIRAPVVWGLLLALSVTALHSVYWSNIRMRAPVMPVVYLCAALSMGLLADYLRRRKALLK